MTKNLRPPAILTSAGTYFDFTSPETFQFDIELIAHSLANTCRFNGHVSEFYSVAQHSVIVSRIVPPEYAFAALLHDAAEAFLGDVNSPLKSLLPDYQAVEQRVEAAVALWFGVPALMDPIINDADKVALATEKRDLLPRPKEVRIWSATEQREPLAEIIVPLLPYAAKLLFLQRFDEIAEWRERNDLEQNPEGK